MRILVLETLVVAAMFSAAIAVTDSVTGRQPMSICSAGRTVILQEHPDPSIDPWESRRLEE